MTGGWVEPIGGQRFNNGRFFVFMEHPWTNLYAAQQIRISEPHESLLGYDDPSVRQFYPLYRFLNGVIVRTAPAADFLYIREIPGRRGSFELIVRELKFYRPGNDVDVEHALTQLQTTIENLNISLPHLPISIAEIIVPERGYRMAAGYRRSRHPAPNIPVYFLFDSTDHNVRVYSHGQPIRVTVRMIPFPNFE